MSVQTISNKALAFQRDARLPQAPIPPFWGCTHHGEVFVVVQAISDEALAFQREKQVRLNQVEVVLLLRLHQIHYLQDGQLPSDLSDALLFSNAELDKLKRRVHVGFAINSLLSAELQKLSCLVA